MKRIFNKIFTYLSRPFVDELTFFLCTFILISIVDIFYYLNHGLYVYTMYIISHGIMDSYIITFLSCLFSPKLNKILKTLFYIYVYIFFIINVYCLLVLEQPFNLNAAAIILGTNLSEVFDFLSSCFTINVLSIVCVTLFLSLFSLFYFSARKSLMGKGKVCIALIILLICCCLNIHNISPWKELIFGETYTFTEVPIVPNLKKYYSHPSIEKVSNQPENIVVIFGESYTKTHSSLYGYEKETNPYLSQLEEDSLLFVFDNIKCAGLNTIDSFKAMMSLYRPNMKDKKNWYECTTLQEIINLSSYKSIWVSNQSKTGFYDNVIGKYADLCDENYFVGNKYAGWYRKTYDEDVVKILDKLPKETSEFFFVHLMGSHYSFSSRYPKHFSKYIEDDYLDYPTQQRHNLATYDNSVLYNDSVVFKIIDQFKDKETIIFYFPDHSIDLYDSSDDYVGHAKYSNPKSAEVGYKIPFMIYCSERYKNKFAEIVKKIQMSIKKDYCTEDLIYTAMEIMGVKFSGNNDVQKYSLLSK